MTDRTYWATHGGHPPQTDMLTDRAMFREAYAVIPRARNGTSWPPSCPSGRPPACGSSPGR